MFLQGTELYQISHKLRTLTAKLSGKPVISSTSASETKDSQIVKQEIEQMFHQLENEPKSDTNVLDSLQNLSLAIEKRRKSETLMSANGKCDNDAKVKYLLSLQDFFDIAHLKISYSRWNRISDFSHFLVF